MYLRAIIIIIIIIIIIFIITLIIHYFGSCVAQYSNYFRSAKPSLDPHLATKHFS
jgi:TM2 domain-containing membrane protein YozV